MNTRANKWFWVAVGGLTLAACSDLGSPIKLVPQLELSATSLDFGTVVVSASATRSVAVGNSGNAPLNGLAAVSCAGYSLDAGGGTFTVPPAGQHTVVVRFQPSGVGSSPCELTLGSGLPSVTLSGNGALQAPGAVCTVSVPSIDFGTIRAGTSKPGAFKVYSTGTLPVTLNVVSGCGEFSILAGGGPRTLAPGDSVAVSLGFAPGAGGRFSCTIATGPGCPDVTVTGDATTVSFATQVLPIFNSTGCNGCHLFQRTTDIVNVTSQLGYAPAVLVKPFDPNNSLLYNKVANTNPLLYGMPMPYGSANGLPPSQRTTIRTWILEGAHNN
jgi:hypothetical protein